jgi:hypothetical protein
MNSGPYRKSPRVVERTIRGERVLVPLASSSETLDSLYTLNETAGLIWDLAGAGKSEPQITEALSAQYDVSTSTARADVAAVLSDLIEAGVLQRREQG